MKRCLFILFGVLCIEICSAQSVSRETATRVAQNYWNITYADKDQRTNTISHVRTISPSGNAPLYVVQMDDGWVLLSSENAATPILASSPSGYFPDYEDMPDGMQWFMSYYEDANQYARDSLMGARIVNEEWGQLLNGTYYQEYQNKASSLPSSYVLDRMALVKWNQSSNNDGSCTKPFNAHCPTWYEPSCGHTYAGSVAVAMGMVMWYWQWPYSAKIPRQFFNMNNINSYSNTPYLATYDWVHMPPELHNTTPDYDANLLAYFLRDCGYSISMTYNNSSSSADMEDVESALESTFHYNVGSLEEKDDYTNAAWINLLKQEIYMGRPILYTGERTGNIGHVFVLFGYTADNKFRVNFGWGGSYINATYSLDALGPSGYMYNYEQEAYFGVEPDSPTCLTYNYLHQRDINGSIFQVHKSGTLINDTANWGVTISGVKTGCIYASEAIVLTSPFAILSGANVHLAIRDALCGNNSPATLNMPSNHNAEGETKNKLLMPSSHVSDKFVILPNPASDYIEIRTNETLTDISIISSSGLCVLQSTNLFIPVSQLPSGLYIVSAVNKEGKLLQAKFLKQ